MSIIIGEEEVVQLAFPQERERITRCLEVSINENHSACSRCLGSVLDNLALFCKDSLKVLDLLFCEVLPLT